MKIVERSKEAAGSFTRPDSARRRVYVLARNSAAYAETQPNHSRGHLGRADGGPRHAHPLRAVRAAVFPQAP